MKNDRKIIRIYNESEKKKNKEIKRGDGRKNIKNEKCGKKIKISGDGISKG